MLVKFNINAAGHKAGDVVEADANLLKMVGDFVSEVIEDPAEAAERAAAEEAQAAAAVEAQAKIDQAASKQREEADREKSIAKAQAAAKSDG